MKKVVGACILLVTVMIISVGCRQHVTPKPRGYFRIELPEKSYEVFDADYPFRFQHLKAAEVKSDSSVNSEKYWLNVEYPSLNGQIHISYKAIDNNLYELLEDSRKLAYKHTIKADAINERMFSDEAKNILGVVYEIKGNAASPMQFFATDSLNHFIRGALYFNATPNQDSLAPVIDFVQEDVIKLMETLEWNNSIR